MRKIDKYEISDVYTLKALQDTERGYLDFRVKRNDIDKPEIEVISDPEDYSVYYVKVLTTSLGMVDSLELESYIIKLEEAREAAEEIEEILYSEFNVNVVF